LLYLWNNINLVPNNKSILFYFYIAPIYLSILFLDI